MTLPLRVLYVAPEWPWPARTGSQIVASHHLRSLGRAHAVTLFALSNEVEALSPPEGYTFADVRQFNRRIGKIERARRIASGELPQVAAYRSPALAEAVRQVLPDHDIALFQMTQSAQFLPTGSATPCIWFLEDPPIIKNCWLRRTQGLLARLATSERIRRLSRYELRMMPHFDRVLLLNRADAVAYGPYYPNTSFDWVPYGVEPDEQLGESSQRVQGRIVISGTLAHPANAAAAIRFAREIFPRIRTARPDAHLQLVGAAPPNAVRALAGIPGVTVHANVPDVRHFLRAASVAVCAIDFAYGTQTKVLEALACGTPLVTTTAGNHGIMARDGVEVIVANSTREIASAVTELLDPPRGRQMGTAGRQFVIEAFNWNLSSHRLETILHQVIAERRQKPRQHVHVAPSVA